MIEELAENIACFYAKNGIIKGDKDIYAYGFGLLLSTLCNVALIIVIAILFDVLVEAVFYFSSFVLLRSLGGGYHARTHAGCIGAFSTLFLAFVVIIKYMPAHIIPLYVLICTITASVVIWKVAPVEAANKPLSSTKKARLKNSCLMIACFYMILAILICYLPIIQNSIICFTYSGLLAAASSMAAGVKI